MTSELKSILFNSLIRKTVKEDESRGKIARGEVGGGDLFVCSSYFHHNFSDLVKGH